MKKIFVLILMIFIFSILYISAILARNIKINPDGFGGYRGYDYDSGSSWVVHPDGFDGYDINIMGDE